MNRCVFRRSAKAVDYASKRECIKSRAYKALTSIIVIIAFHCIYLIVYDINETEVQAMLFSSSYIFLKMNEKFGSKVSCVLVNMFRLSSYLQLSLT